MSRAGRRGRGGGCHFDEMINLQRVCARRHRCNLIGGFAKINCALFLNRLNSWEWVTCVWIFTVLSGQKIVPSVFLASPVFERFVVGGGEPGVSQCVNILGVSRMNMDQTGPDAAPV